ncbi:MAG TPA: hypothetical protein VOA41_08935 [Candidatus Dormibacteraeota bacterium]|nr:hypothetical protein [Candidatus Dormibacteraeota bacterium]
MNTKLKTTKKAGALRKLSQRLFVYEKIFGSNDKEAALAAGYSLSVAENTKQKIWRSLASGESFND